MGAILDLPTELSSFLRRKPPQTLLIRGAPGTGKTTLGLALLQAFVGKRVYVTARVSADEIARDYPAFFRKDSGGATLVDDRQRGKGLASALKAMSAVHKLVADPTADEDLRSLLLPSEVLDAWSRSSPTEPAMVVLDSWDAIVEKHLGSRGGTADALALRHDIERWLIDQMNDGPVFTVIIVEDRQANQFEYLVNGIVTLTLQTTDDRPERWLHLEKLRGVRIASPAYPFTLESARFQCAGHFDSQAEINAGPLHPDPNPVPGTMWPGSREYAEHFGRPHIGRMSIIEKDHEVSDNAVRLLVAPFLANTLANGGRTVGVLPPRISPSDVWRIFRSTLPREAFLERVRLETPVPVDEEDEFRSIVLRDRTERVGSVPSRTHEVLRFLSENRESGRPNLAVIWTVGLRALDAQEPGTYTPESVPAIAQSYFRHAVLHQVIIGSPEDPYIDAVRPMAETRIAVTARNGRVFVHGIDPPTPNLVLSTGDSSSPFRLLLVV